jgi:nucleoid DNA-binding protein
MTKAELIARVHARKDLPRGLTKKTVQQIVNDVFVEMGDYFISARGQRGGSVKLTYPGFGTFLKRHRPLRVVKNPRTGEPVPIPSHFTISFSPSAELKSLMNRSNRPKTVVGGK